MTTEYVFKAFDGKVFEDEDECLEYELTAGLPEGTKIGNIGAYTLNESTHTFTRSTLDSSNFVICHSAAELELFMRSEEQTGYAIPYIHNADILCYIDFIAECHRIAGEQSYPLVLEYDTYDDEWKDYDKETTKIINERSERYINLMSIDNA